MEEQKGICLCSYRSCNRTGKFVEIPFSAYKNGGGAFFLPYIVALFTCGVPLMILEYQYGRKTRGGSTKAFRLLGKKFEWIGWLQVMVPLIVMMFYNTIISVSVVFMVWSLGHAFGIINWMSNPGPLWEQ